MRAPPLRLNAAGALALLLGSALHVKGQPASPTLTPLHTFTGCAEFPAQPCDGISPNGLVIGTGGVLYGTTEAGGSGVSNILIANENGSGTVFSLTPPLAAGGQWTETILYSFQGGGPYSLPPADGGFPLGVVIGSGGVLYGTTGFGGTGTEGCLTNGQNPPFSIGCGTVFSVTPPLTPGGPWTQNVLWNFAAGAEPSLNSIVFDVGGVLYGATIGNDAVDFGCGYVYSLSPPSTFSGGQWSLAALYSFSRTAGDCGLNSGVVIGDRSLLYGFEYAYGPPEAGMVFSLTPPSASGQPWAENALYTFPEPLSLVAGVGGVLYGTAYTASSPYGIVFSLTPPNQPGGIWTEATIYNFTANEPAAGLAIGSGDVLYIVTNPCPGAVACLYSLTPPAQPGGAWTKATLHDFTGGSDGCVPSSPLVTGTDGTLYGTTGICPAGGDGTVFSIKLATPKPSINPGGLVTAASYAAPVAPGSIASVFGSFFVPSVGVTQLPLPETLAGLSLQFNTISTAPLFFVSGGQVNLQVPWELAGQAQGSLTATLNGQSGTAQTVNLATFAPAIFTTNAQGSGPGAILDASNRLVDASNPATPGSTVLQIFCTGLGPVTNQPQTGSPAPLTSLSYTLTTPTVKIGGALAGITFSGLAPGYVGLYQVNAEVPAGLTANTAAPVVISMQGTSSNTVTIAVQ